MTRILFASWHWYLDQSNGASITTRETLLALARRGWDVKTFCGAATDFFTSPSVDDILTSSGVAVKKRFDGGVGEGAFRAVSYRDSGVESVVVAPRSGLGVGVGTVPSRPAGAAFLQLFAETLRRLSPDVVLTYGGYWLGGDMLKLAKKSGAKTVAWLHNLAYRDAGYFRDVDSTLVPSEFAADVYRKRLGLDPVAVPPLIDWRKVRPENAEEDEDDARKFVLFVNPSVGKGAPLFAKIVEETNKIRPEIPFLVVEGSAASSALARCDWERRDGWNLFRAANTSTPREFYRVAKLALIPSFFEESFGRVAAEALGAGVPVVASNRGALPETVGDAGILLDIPERLTPTSQEKPTAADAAPWVDAIISLWDGDERRKALRENGLQRAKRWTEERVVELYEAALR
ncbi:MAG: glycosyltransferase family 4 protein [Thermoguttaceae bacterium]|nr:glycosyltransferase family 4 protein [Thermoguttaceae bacterium]